MYRCVGQDFLSQELSKSIVRDFRLFCALCISPQELTRLVGNSQGATKVKNTKQEKVQLGNPKIKKWSRSFSRAFH